MVGKQNAPSVQGRRGHSAVPPWFADRSRRALCALACFLQPGASAVTGESRRDLLGPRRSGARPPSALRPVQPLGSPATFGRWPPQGARSRWPPSLPDPLHGPVRQRRAGLLLLFAAVPGMQLVLIILPVPEKLSSALEPVWSFAQWGRRSAGFTLCTLGRGLRLAGEKISRTGYRTLGLTFRGAEACWAQRKIDPDGRSPGLPG